MAKKTTKSKAKTTKAKTKTKPTAKSKTKKTTTAKTKRKPNPAFMKPMTIGTALQPIVGNGPYPRTEVVKRVWGYIKKNNLQDARERRNINADDNLKKVFGGKKTVSMFEMTKLINGHLS
jgi:upstream activation factor subunit UAF30